MSNPTEQEFYEQAQYDRVVAQNRSLQEENKQLRKLLLEILIISQNHNGVPDLPCGMEICKYPNCFDDITECGETCMRRGLDKIRNLITEVNK